MADDTIPPIRGKRKTKKVPSKAKVAPEIKEKILERVAREEKAYRIVERLIDNPVSFQLLTKSIKYINQSVYNDIVDERSIIKNCGYPLCRKSLARTLKKQTYAINSRTNKVYKLEERNKFCSPACFTFSRGLRDQLSPEPVWFMPKYGHLHVTITPMDADSGGCEELPKNQKIDEKHLHENEVTVKHFDIKENVQQPAQRSTPKEIRPIDNACEAVDLQFSWLDLGDSDDVSDEEDAAPQPPTMSLIGAVKHCLTQWRTSKTAEFLAGTVHRRSVSEDDIVDEDDLLDTEMRMCPPDNNMAPVPHFKDLKDNKVEVKENQEPKSIIVLPQIDSVNQVQQRNNVFLRQLQPAVDKILQKTQFQYRDFSGIFISLLSSMNIGSSNCMFSEKQWLLIAAVILVSAFTVIPALREALLRSQFEDTVWREIRLHIPEKTEFRELCEYFQMR